MPAKAALLTFLTGLSSGCEAQREIGRNCPAAGCDRAALDGAEPACKAEFVMPETTVVAIAPLYRCQVFTLDALQTAAGSDRVFITKAVATMAPHSHEIDVRIAPPEIAGVADGPIDCADILDRPVAWEPLIESVGGSEDWDFASAPLAAERSQRLLIAERYTNLAAQPIAVGVTLRLECAEKPPARPSQVFAFVDRTPHVVGPAQQVIASGHCSFDRDVAVWRLYRPSQRISAFSAWRGNDEQKLWGTGYESMDPAAYQGPIDAWSVDLAPPLHLAAGTVLRWACTYDNRSDMAFEIGGDSGYECALMGIFQLGRDDAQVQPLICAQ
jgi:hypothetical protein